MYYYCTVVHGWFRTQYNAFTVHTVLLYCILESTAVILHILSIRINEQFSELFWIVLNCTISISITAGVPLLYSST